MQLTGRKDVLGKGPQLSGGSVSAPKALKNMLLPVAKHVAWKVK